MDEKTRTLKEHLASLALKTELARQEVEWREFERQQEFIPNAWYRMDKIAPCTEPKQQITLRLDRDMVKFYRTLGRGYQGRMNAILRTYMLARISRIITVDGQPEVPLEER
ncbi:MAG: BrnA antitoxin family protein [Pseudomonadota bacterium]